MQLAIAEAANGTAGGAPLLPSSASSRPRKATQGQLASCLAALRHALPSFKKAAALKGRRPWLVPPSFLASLQRSLEQASLLAQLLPALLH